MRRTLHAFLLAAAGLTWSLVAQADEAKLLAVLPLDVTHSEGKLSEAARASVEESLRDVAANALSSHGWLVMSGENALQILADNGIDPTKCGDQTCHLGLARELKVEKFISGAVMFVDGQLRASVRLIDTRSGRIVGSERLTGATATELQIAFDGRAVVFFARCGLIEGKPLPPEEAPRPPRERVTEPYSALEFVQRHGVWMTSTMVPVDAYARCVWADGCFEPEARASEECNWKRRRSEPVNCLDSARAKQFCEWMGGRLPTKSELRQVESKGGNLTSAFVEEQEVVEVLKVGSEIGTKLKIGEESFRPDVGLWCVLPGERVAAMP